jgi:hypothetical protein
VVAPLGFYILGNLMIPGQLLRDLSEYHKMLLLMCDVQLNCCDDVPA